jgi:HEPN domain-containing protein
MDNKFVANEWFEYADNDLRCAIFLLQMHPIPVEIICYHCQQSAEKYLKGYIALNGGEIVKTHDLTILNKICIGYDQELQLIRDDCVELVDYGVQVRYPVETELEEQDMKKAIESAETIQKFIFTKTSS